MIKFESRLNPEKLKQLNKHTMKKVWWAYLVISLSFVIWGIFELDEYFIVGLMLILFGVLFTPILLLATNSSSKKAGKDMPLMSEQTMQNYVFDYESIYIEEQKGDDYRAEVTMKYSCLNSVNETATEYFLYISKAQAHVISKSELVEGSLDELNDIFARNLGAKFKPYKHK